MNLSSGKNEAYESSELQENLEILRQIYFFSGLPLESLKVFAYMCTRETFKQEEYLFRQGDDDGQAFYIVSGRAGLVHTDGGGEKMIRDYDTGEFLGGMVLLGNMHRLFSLKALTDVTCLIMTREKFSTTIQQFPDLMPRIIKSVVERISAWESGFLVSRGDGCEVCGQKVGVSLV
jgi:CRP-like cAMP-binding protein